MNSETLQVTEEKNLLLGVDCEERHAWRLFKTRYMGHVRETQVQRWPSDFSFRFVTNRWIKVEKQVSIVMLNLTTMSMRIIFEKGDRSWWIWWLQERDHDEKEKNKSWEEWMHTQQKISYFSLKRNKVKILALIIASNRKKIT